MSTRQKTSTVKTGHFHITRKKGVCGGEPIIVKTRTSVRSIVGYYKMGMTVDEILEGLPHLKPAEVYGALAYYFDHQQEIERYIEENDEERLIKKIPPGKYI